MISNRSDLKRIYEAHFNMLCGRAYAILRDEEKSRDCVQSMFLSLWEKRGRLNKDVNIENYLSKAVRNRAIDEYRKSKTRKQHTESKMKGADIWEEQNHPISDLQINLRKRLLTEINTFKPKMKEIFLLHYSSGLTQVEISEHMGIPKRTVEDNLTRAYKLLKENLASDQKFISEFVST